LLRAIRLLNLRRLREQKLRSCLAVLAIASGVSLTVGVLIDQASIDRSARDFGSARAGDATFVVHGAANIGGLRERTVERVRAVPGVAQAAPIIQAVTIAESAAGDEHFVIALGIDCAVEAVVGTFGCTPEMLDFLAGSRPVISTSLAARLGRGGVVRTDLARIPVADAQTVPALDDFNGGRIAVFSLRAAEQHFGRDSAVDAIFVVPDAGADQVALRAALQRAAGPQNVVARADTPPDVSSGTSTLLPFLFLLSLVGLAIGAQLVHNTVALSLEERRRDFAVEAALGARPTLLIAGVLTEAALLGAAGGMLGIGGGVLLAHPMASELSKIIAQVVGIHISISVPASAIAIGLLLGLLTSVVAAVNPARRAVQVNIAAELHGQASAAEVVRGPSVVATAVLLALGAGGLGLSWLGSRGGSIDPWQPPAAIVGLVMTAALLLPAAARVVPFLLQRVSRIARLQGGVAEVALANLVANPRRVRAMTMAVVTGVAMASMLGGVNQSIPAGANLFLDQQSDRVLATTLPTNNSGAIEAKVPPRVIDQLASMPGVRGIERQVFLELNHPSVGLVGVSAYETTRGDAYTSRPNFPVYLGRDPDAAIARGEIAIGVALARDLGVRPGDDLRLPTRDGFVDLRIGTVWGDGNDLGRAVNLRYDLAEKYWGRHSASQIFAVPAAGVSGHALARRIEAADLDPDLRAYDTDALAVSLATEVRRFLNPFWALQRGMLVVAVVAAASTLLLVGVQRRREHALLAALGLRPTGLARMLLIEAGAVGIAASVLGAVVGAATLVSFLLGSGVLTGLRPPFRFDLVVPVLYGALSTVLVMLGGLFPAVRATRVDPAVALRQE
jgi:putative ABC transport system permease protein